MLTDIVGHEAYTGLKCCRVGRAQEFLEGAEIWRPVVTLRRHEDREHEPLDLRPELLAARLDRGASINHNSAVPKVVDPASSSDRQHRKRANDDGARGHRPTV